MIKAAVIGVGAMGKNHARVYRELSDVTLVGVSDASAETAARVGRHLNVPHFTDYVRLLDAHRPDIVSVAVPTNLHFEVAKSLVARGIHVLIEKPITETVEQAQALIKLAAEAGVKLGVGHIERFNPAVAELRRRLEDGALGETFRVQSRRMGPFPARIRDVGVVIDLASHDLDMVRYVLGVEVTRVYAETANSINTDREDIVDCVLRCENGVIGTLNVNWMTPTKIRELSIIGARGMFLVNYLTQELYFYENQVAPSRWDQLSILTNVSEGNTTRYQIARYEPLKAELDNFVQAVQNDGAPLVSGEDGLRALGLAQALMRSGQEHRAIGRDEMPWLASK